MRSLSVGMMLWLLAAGTDVDPSFRSTEGFGDTRWGMTREEVKAAVPSLQEHERGLHVMGEVAGKQAQTFYLFSANRLTVAGIIVQERYVNENRYLTDYRELQELLTKKYGPPQTQEVSWSKDLYRDRPDRWGLAVSAGHLRMWTIWETPKTKIELSCTGEKFQTTVRVRYASKELEHLFRKQQEADKLKGL